MREHEVTGQHQRDGCAPHGYHYGVREIGTGRRVVEDVENVRTVEAVLVRD